jgi:hypothetical protein
MHIVVVEALLIAIYLTEKRDVYIPIQPTSLPEATSFSWGLPSQTCYELASSNRDAAYSQQLGVPEMCIKGILDWCQDFPGGSSCGWGKCLHARELHRAEGVGVLLLIISHSL